MFLIRPGDPNRHTTTPSADIHGVSERANSSLKTTFKALRRVSLGPNRITEIAAAALFLLQLEYGRGRIS